MDLDLVIFLVALYGLAYLVLAQAKDRSGQKYGFKKMARMWLYALPYLTSAFIEFSIKSADGSSQEVKITYSAFFLWIMPIAMIADNFIRRKRANQSSEPTSPSVTDRADARSAPAGGVAHL